MCTTGRLAPAFAALFLGLCSNHVRSDEASAASGVAASASAAEPRASEAKSASPPVDGALSSPLPPATDLLLAAAKENDDSTVKKLVLQGANVNSAKDNLTVLGHAVLNSNLSLARWLVDHGADIERTSIFYSNRDNHLARYTANQREIAAYLIYTRLVKMGYPLPKAAANVQILFLKKVKEAIVERLKQDGLWPEKVAKNWAIRLVDVKFPVKLVSVEGDSSFMVYCDIAVWNESMMLEIATKTGMTFALPNALEGAAASHAWLFSSDNGTSVLSTRFEPGKVLWGDFLLTRTKQDQYSAKRVVYK